MDMTPQAWPAAGTMARHINEVLFCQQFLEKHPHEMCARAAVHRWTG